MTDLNKEEQLQALKNRANMLGITFHPNIKYDKLKEKVDEKLAEMPDKDPMDTGLTPQKTEGQLKMERIKKASKLIRLNITSVDPNKRDWSGEYFIAGNSEVGFFKKYVPYGLDWHVPEIILNTIKDKKCAVYLNDPKQKGQKIRKLVKAYNVDILPPLTKEEIEELAKAQAASGRLED